MAIGANDVSRLSMMLLKNALRHSWWRAVEGSIPFAPKFRKPGSLSPGLFVFIEVDERCEGSAANNSN